MREVGVIDLAIADVTRLLDTDPTLATLPSYSSQWDVDANTPKPCKSVDLEVEKDSSEPGYSGGCIDEYTATGFIIIYLEPDYEKTQLRSKLDEYRERVRNVIKTATLTDDFQVLNSWEYVESKPRPWLIQHQGGPKLLAHRMIIDFTATYSVKEET